MPCCHACMQAATSHKGPGAKGKEGRGWHGRQWQVGRSACSLPPFPSKARASCLFHAQPAHFPKCLYAKHMQKACMPCAQCLPMFSGGGRGNRQVGSKTGRSCYRTPGEATVQREEKKKGSRREARLSMPSLSAQRQQRRGRNTEGSYGQYSRKRYVRNRGRSCHARRAATAATRSPTTPGRVYGRLRQWWHWRMRDKKRRLAARVVQKCE